MEISNFASTWKQLSEADKSAFVDNVGEHLERISGVTSSAGEFGQIEGVDSRALIEAIDHSFQQLMKGKG